MEPFSTFSPLGSFALAAVLALYILFLIAVGFIAGRKVHSSAEYLLAGRDVPLPLAILSLLATWFGSSAILGTTQSTYSFGMSGTILEPFACGLTLIFCGAFFAKRLWNLGLATIADLFGEKLGPAGLWISSAIQVPTFFFWIGAQYLSIGALLEVYLEVPAWIGIVGSACVTLMILWNGGMWAVTWTDAIMVSISLLGLFILFFATANQLGHGNTIDGITSVIARTPQERLQLLPNPTIASSLTALGIFLTGLLGNIPAQDLQQRIQCARSASTAKWSCILAGCIYIAMGLIPIYLGLAARLHLEEWDTNDRIQSDQVLPILASQFLSEPFGILLVVGLVSLNLAAAGSSTISQTTILSNNVLPRTKRDWGNANGTTKNWLLKNWLAPRREQWCAFAVTVGSLMAAFSGQSVMGLLELSLASVLVSLFVPMCLCLFSNPSTPWSGIVPMLVGPAVWGTKLTWDAWNLSSSESLATNNPDFPAQLSWFAWPNWGQYYGIIPAEIQGLLASVLAMLVAETIARGLRKRSNHVVTPT